MKEAASDDSKMGQVQTVAAVDEGIESVLTEGF